MYVNINRTAATDSGNMDTDGTKFVWHVQVLGGVLDTGH